MDEQSPGLLSNLTNSGGIEFGPAMVENLDPPQIETPDPYGVLTTGMMRKFNYDPLYEDDVLEFEPFVLTNDVFDYSNFGGIDASHASPRVQNILIRAKAHGVLDVPNAIFNNRGYYQNYTGNHSVDLDGVDTYALIRHQQFFDSLTPIEQDEYSNFLGIDFKKIGKAIGSAAKAVGKGVAAVGKGIGKAAVGTAHAVRSVALGTAHVARDVGVAVGHGARAVGIAVGKGAVVVGKFTWKNLPYIAAGVAVIIGQPEIAAAILGAMVAMKNKGMSDAEIQQALEAQYGAGLFGGGGMPGAEYDPDADNIDDTDISDWTENQDGTIDLGDGTTYDPLTGTIFNNDGIPNASQPSDNDHPNRKYWIWGAVIVVVGVLVWYLHKKGKLKFKF